MVQNRLVLIINFLKAFNEKFQCREPEPPGAAFFYLEPEPTQVGRSQSWLWDIGHPELELPKKVAAPQHCLCYRTGSVFSLKIANLYFKIKNGILTGRCRQCCGAATSGHCCRLCMVVRALNCFESLRYFFKKRKCVRCYPLGQCCGAGTFWSEPV